MKIIVSKTSKAFKEVPAAIAGVKNPIILGIKLYGKKDKDALQEEYKKVSVSVPLEKAQAELEVFLKEGDKTTDEFYSLRESMLENITKLSEEYVAGITEFYKKQVLFLKNVAITVADDKGVESILAIADTRVVEPVESLWVDSNECLAVLLDYYFEEEAYKDSLPGIISSTVFNYTIKKEEKLKN